MAIEQANVQREKDKIREFAKEEEPISHRHIAVQILVIYSRIDTAAGLMKHRFFVKQVKY